MTVLVLGDETLVRKLRAFRQLSDLQKEYSNAGETIADTARALVPVETGLLLSSIRYKVLSQKTVVQAGTRGFPYAPLVHYGVYPPGNSAQPFLTTALAAASGFIGVQFDAGMDGAMRKAGV